MQFTEVLTRDEKKHLARFATSFEQEYALSDEFQVVSLARTLELGGFTPVHFEPEKKAEKKAEPPAPPTNTLDPSVGSGFASWIQSREEAMRQQQQRSYEEMMRQQMIAVERRVVMRDLLGYAPAQEERPLTDWNIPKLALAPVRSPGVTLSSGGKGGMYELKAGEWKFGFRPSWHTAFPSRGRAGFNLYRSNYEAQLPPLPREAQAVVKDFGADKSVVLWEADWEQREQYLDPAILVPVWRDLYSVVYTWDLTDAERSALKKASGN